MELSNYYAPDITHFESAYLCRDGWWRFKDEWGIGGCKGYGDSMFQDDCVKYNRNSHNLIFMYETK